MRFHTGLDLLPRLILIVCLLFLGIVVGNWSRPANLDRAVAPPGVYDAMSRRMDGKDLRIAELLQANEDMRLAYERCLDE